jgi:hypothetical protein
MERLPSNTASNVSPIIRNKLNIKTIKNTVSQGLPIAQLSNIFKLKNDYQVYLIQVSQILSQEEHIVLNALKIDL